MAATDAEVPNRITVGDGLTVNRVGYGAMKLTGDHVWGEYPDREQGIAVLRGVVEAGIDFIDTADVYGPHTNETLIHDALYPYPEGLVIATKGGFVRGGYSYDTLDAVGNVNYLRQSAHMSAKRLGVEAIDLYYLHSGRATDAHRATMQQIALAWQLRRTPVSLPIPGTTSLAHLRENLEAESIRLSDEEFAAISAISPES